MIGELFDEALLLHEHYSPAQLVDADWEAWGKNQTLAPALRIVGSYIYRNEDRAKLLEPGEFTQFMALLNKACTRYQTEKGESFANEAWAASQIAPRV